MRHVTGRGSFNAQKREFEEAKRKTALVCFLLLHPPQGGGGSLLNSVASAGEHSIGQMVLRTSFSEKDQGKQKDLTAEQIKKLMSFSSKRRMGKGPPARDRSKIA